MMSSPMGAKESAGRETKGTTVRSRNMSLPNANATKSVEEASSGGTGVEAKGGGDVLIHPIYPHQHNFESQDSCRNSGSGRLSKHTEKKKTYPMQRTNSSNHVGIDTGMAFSRYNQCNDVVRTHSVFLEKEEATKENQRHSCSDYICYDVKTLGRTLCFSPVLVAFVSLIIVGTILTEAAVNRSKSVFEDDFVTTLNQEVRETGRVARRQMIFFSESKSLSALIYWHSHVFQYIGATAHTLFARTLEGEVVERSSADDFKFFTSSEWPGFSLGTYHLFTA